VRDGNDRRGRVVIAGEDGGRRRLHAQQLLATGQTIRKQEVASLHQTFVDGDAPRLHLLPKTARALIGGAMSRPPQNKAYSTMP